MTLRGGDLGTLSFSSDQSAGAEYLALVTSTSEALHAQSMHYSILRYTTAPNPSKYEPSEHNQKSASHSEWKPNARMIDARMIGGKECRRRRPSSGVVFFTSVVHYIGHVVARQLIEELLPQQKARLRLSLALSS